MERCASVKPSSTGLVPHRLTPVVGREHLPARPGDPGTECRVVPAADERVAFPAIAATLGSAGSLARDGALRSGALIPPGDRGGRSHRASRHPPVVDCSFRGESKAGPWRRRCRPASLILLLLPRRQAPAAAGAAARRAGRLALLGDPLAHCSHLLPVRISSSEAAWPGRTQGGWYSSGRAHPGTSSLRRFALALVPAAGTGMHSPLAVPVGALGGP